MSTPTAMELEGHIVRAPLPSDVPLAALSLFESESAFGVPTAIASMGGKYYVIQTSGQGPYIIWPRSEVLEGGRDAQEVEAYGF